MNHPIFDEARLAMELVILLCLAVLFVATLVTLVWVAGKAVEARRDRRHHREILWKADLIQTYVAEQPRREASIKYDWEWTQEEANAAATEEFKEYDNER